VNKTFLLILIVFVITGGLFSCFLYGDFSRKYETKPVFFANPEEEQVEAVLYLPRHDSESCSTCCKTDRMPAFISVHSGFQNSETLQPAFSSIAENNIIVMEILLDGRKTDGTEKNFGDYVADVRGGVEFLRKHPRVDKDRIFLSGHSIGANIASIIGSSSDKTAGVIAVGYPVEFSADSSVSLLMTAGVYDQLHEPAKMEKAFSLTFDDESVSQGSILTSPSLVGKTALQRKKGSRIYFRSFLTDHYTESVDPMITATIVSFIRSSEFQGYSDYIPVNFNFVKFGLRVFSRIFFYLSLVFLFVYLFLRLKTNKYFKQKIPGILHERIFSIIFLLACFVISRKYEPGEDLTGIYVVSALMTAVFIFNFFILKLKLQKIKTTFDFRTLSEIFIRGTVKFLITGGVIYFCFLAGLYIHAGLRAYSTIPAALGTLTGVIYLVFGHVFIIITRANSFFLNVDRTFGQVSPVLWIVTTVELFYPGGIVRIFDEVLSLMIKNIREIDFSLKWKFNWSGVILLIILLISGISVWKRILAEGYVIGINEIAGLGYLFLCFIVIPVLGFISMMRWQFIRQLMTRPLFQGDLTNE
jgi:hypothetical protein